MEQPNLYTENQLDIVRQQSVIATERSKELERLFEEAQHISSIWRVLIDYLTKGWSCHIYHLLDLEKRLITGSDANSQLLTSTIDQIYISARKQAELQQKRFPAYIEDACRRINLAIDRGSRHPTYTFYQGFFKLVIDDRKFIARLFDYEGKIAEFPADIDAAIEIIQREHKRVFDRPFDGNTFIRKLRGHYLAITEKGNIPDGTEIPIRKITRRLGKNVEGFRTDEFLIDLSRLAEKGPTEIDGRRLYLQHTKDTNQGMLLYGLGSGYIGYIVFKKE
ncbi:MAG: hypothetical protein JXB15_09165 [Anaerolineales bacterium]|nr:hypothetical protein [Anaerolineales bacterium]